MKEMKRTSLRAENIPYVFPDVDDRIPIIPYEEFRRIMLSRNIETNNPKLHYGIVHHFNPNREHWLKTFIDRYSQELQGDE